MVENTLHEVDVGELLENRRLGRFQVLTLALGSFTLFVDGLDFSAPNVAAQSIVSAFHIKAGDMGLVFGWGYFGMFIGSVLLGAIGDRYGRKTGVVLGVLAYSLPALLTVFATSLEGLAIWRFLAGIGIGGVVPNAIALLTETAPKRFRVSFVMIAFVGYSTGNAACAQIAAWFIPVFGWSIVFLVAGLAGLGLSLMLIFVLPESIPFLAVRRPDDPRLRRLMARAAPELQLLPETRLILCRPANEMKFSLKLLFTSYRRFATPLLWIAFFGESLTFMTLSSWLTSILEQAGLSQMQARLVFSAGAIAAIFAIVIFGRLIDRFGPRAVVVCALSAVASIVYLGTPGLSPNVIVIVAILAYPCASATHQSLNGIVGGFYPTIIRGNGVGYATGMGRVAAILGPVVAGYLIEAKVPVQDVLFFIAAPDLMVAAACVGLDVLRRSRFAAADFAPAVPAREPREQLA
ncbi:MAG TPA: MFS transporter [Micropepsaceae bacterium]|nr:MFS transporter [Micropepsaceae bacterium]